MNKNIYVNVGVEEVNIQYAYKCVSFHSQGAIDLFVGAVRDSHEGKKVIGIHYDVHAPLVKKTFYNICEEASDFWPGTRYYISHRYGKLLVGEMSVVIAVSAAHRKESFEACRYVLEEVKKRAPIWKQEHYEKGESAWLPGSSLRHNPDE